MTNGFIHEGGKILPSLENGLHHVAAVFLEVVTLPESANWRIQVLEGHPRQVLMWKSGTCLLRKCFL